MAGNRNLAIPQDARNEAYRLRASLRDISPSTRERVCGTWPVAHVDHCPTLEVRACDDGAYRARWGGLLMCGHIWTCPVCSQNLRAQRAEEVTRAVRIGGGRWQMVTFTVRHRDGLRLRELLGGLLASFRRARQGGVVQRVWSARVSASVRATEVTHGENGWHPHIHVLLRTTEWTDEEREQLLTRWQTIVARVLGPDCVPSREHAIEWSDPFDAGGKYEGRDRSAGDVAARARYVAKLGLEVSGVAKEGRRASRTIWGVLSDAARGDAKSIRLFQEYSEATRGRRMIEMDERARRWADTEEDVKEETFESREPLIIEVPRDDLRAIARVERRGRSNIFATILHAAEVGGETAVREWLAWCRDHQYDKRHAHPAPSAEREAAAPSS